VSISQSGPTAYFYIDDLVDAALTIPPVSGANSVANTFGSAALNNFLFTGALGRQTFWSRFVPPQEFAAFYNGGHGLP
jgi:hypothetical protein